LSDHEESLRTGYSNGFQSLEDSVKSFREHINVVMKEPNKVDIKEIDTVFKRIEKDNKACKENSGAYVQFLESKQATNDMILFILHSFGKSTSIWNALLTYPCRY
jgi:hypothetical protein